MDNNNLKVDPIRKKYYNPLERAEFFVSFFFYFSATLSFTVLLINKDVHPNFYNVFQIFFLLSVVALIIGALSVRLYFAPRAQASRFKDFLSHAYNIPISNEQTSGYYNNNEKDPCHRIAAQTLENSFYSKTTIMEMIKFERIKVSVYFILLLVAIFNRNTDLAIIAILAQLVLSEQILARWLHMECLRHNFEKTYDELFRLFQSRVAGIAFEMTTLEITWRYEMAKANSAITLSTKIFKSTSLAGDEEWSRIRQMLGL